VFITGDVTQIDLPAKVPSGLLHALKVLRNVPGGIPQISIQEMTADDVVRNPLVKKIIQAYNDE
jgi:phosphate starvation-inducible PhoH-like protein